jgi:hypothetical protein
LDQRVVRLLASVIERGGDYALARLELAMRVPEIPLPPTLPRLDDASEASLRRQWTAVERRLEEIGDFVQRIEGERRSAVRDDPAFRWIARTFRELDQYARALRWVLTVTERTSDESQ